jgi:teichuronic acid biosynthesis glycosyltransferase TuaC
MMRILIVCSGNTKNRTFINDQAESLKRLGVQIEYFFITRRGAFGYLKSLESLKTTIKKAGCDLVHAHYGLSGMLSILQRTTPVVITFHGSDINALRNRFISTYAGFFARWNIFVSRRLYQKVCLKPKHYSIIPCGVDLKLFHPIDRNQARNELGLSDARKYVLFPSSFDNRCKNYPLAKKALESLGDVTLLELAGCSRERVNLLINACDAVLMTSLCEGSPQVIKEAMACNCPIVSTDVGDVKESIGNTDGCYITSFKPEDVAKNIRMAIDFGRRTNCRDKIIHLEINNIAQMVLGVYKKVLSK